MSQRSGRRQTAGAAGDAWAAMAAEGAAAAVAGMVAAGVGRALEVSGGQSSCMAGGDVPWRHSRLVQFLCVADALSDVLTGGGRGGRGRGEQ